MTRVSQFHIITLINYVSDQFSGYKNIVVTGTLRDSLVILAGQLNQETKLRPTELMTDTASYTDVVFGLSHLLGYQFSPCLADLGGMRFWRIDPTANYIAKSLFLLSYTDDETYRRRILIQLNKGESRHSLARKIFYGHKGEVRQRYREGQEEQLGALGLVVNAVILWNTIYMDRALEDM